MTAELHWAAPERDEEPFLEVVRRVLPPRGTLLEVASGTGQHAAYFAARLTRRIIAPCDVKPASFAAWREQTKLDELGPAGQLR